MVFVYNIVNSFCESFNTQFFFYSDDVVIEFIKYDFKLHYLYNSLKCNGYIFKIFPIEDSIKKNRRHTN